MSLTPQLQEARTNQSAVVPIKPLDKSKSNQICSEISPPMHPVNWMYRVARAEQMTVDETAM